MFQPKKLKYQFSDYSPYIDAEIMRLHYEGHYMGYINNLNNAINKYPEYFKKSVPDLLKGIEDIPSDIKEIVRNNAGGVANHELFWNILDVKEGSEMPKNLKNEIDKTFGSVEDLKELMLKKLGSHFGSGWIWLVVNKSKKLQVYSLPNQDSPYMTGDIPIMGIDIWEHAYYLQYKNVRAKYLENAWKIINWEEVEKNYNQALI